MSGICSFQPYRSVKQWCVRGASNALTVHRTEALAARVDTPGRFHTFYFKLRYIFRGISPTLIASNTRPSPHLLGHLWLIAYPANCVGSEQFFCNKIEGDQVSQWRVLLFHVYQSTFLLLHKRNTSPGIITVLIHLPASKAQSLFKCGHSA